MKIKWDNTYGVLLKINSYSVWNIALNDAGSLYSLWVPKPRIQGKGTALSASVRSSASRHLQVAGTSFLLLKCERRVCKDWEGQKGMIGVVSKR